jgi:hypothetical protein
MLDEGKLRTLRQVFDVAGVSRDKVIERNDFQAVAQQTINQMRWDKTRTARYYSCFLKVAHNVKC